MVINDNEELRGVINAGHRRNGKVIRLEGTSFIPKEFSCFCPCAIAAIGKLPETIKDRSIIITMRRKLPEEKVEQLRVRLVEDELKVIKSKCARFMKDNAKRAGINIPDAPTALNDRSINNWEALFSIADLISEEWGNKTRNVSVYLSSAMKGEDETSIRTKLLEDIKDIFEETKQEYISSTNLCNYLAEKEDRPWGDWRNGKAITPHSLAKQLGCFNIKPKQKKEFGTNVNRYLLSDFKDVFNRYLPCTPILSSTSLPLALTLGYSEKASSTVESAKNKVLPLYPLSSKEGREVELQKGVEVEAYKWEIVI